MAKKRGYYEGMTETRKQERLDGEMIGTGFGYYANMPDKEVVKLYPKGNFGGTYNLNDGLRGIDVQTKDDNRRKKSGTFPEKY